MEFHLSIPFRPSLRPQNLVGILKENEQQGMKKIETSEYWIRYAGEGGKEQIGEQWCMA